MEGCKHELDMTEYRYHYKSDEAGRVVKKIIYFCSKCNKYFFVNAKNKYLLETKFHNINGWYPVGVWQEQNYKLIGKAAKRRMHKIINGGDKDV